MINRCAKCGKFFEEQTYKLSYQQYKNAPATSPHFRFSGLLLDPRDDPPIALHAVLGWADTKAQPAAWSSVFPKIDDSPL